MGGALSAILQSSLLANTATILLLATLALLLMHFFTHTKKIKNQKAQDFLQAVKDNQIHYVRNLIREKKHTLLNTRGQGTTDEALGNTAAHWAAAKGHEQLLDELLSAGLDVHTRNNADSTPLHSAALNNHIGCVRILRKHGADPHLQDEFGDSPMSVAERANRVDVLEALTAAVEFLKDARTHSCAQASRTGAGENLRAEGNRAFTQGLFAKAEECYLKAIKTTGASAHTRDIATLYSNLSACYASQQKYLEALESAQEVVRIYPTWAKGHSRLGAALLGMERFDEALRAYEMATQMDPDSQHSIQGLKAVKLAMRNKKLEELIERGAFQRRMDVANDGNTEAKERPRREKSKEELEYARTVKAWHDAAKAGNVVALDEQLNRAPWLLSNKSEKTAEQQLGNSALHWAAAKGHEPAVEWLLRIAGADITCQNLGGSTCVHTAAAHGHAKVVRLLLDLGANDSILDELGETAYSAAERRGHVHAMAILDRGSQCAEIRWQRREKPAGWASAKECGNAAFSMGKRLQLREAVAFYTDGIVLLDDSSKMDIAALFSNRSAAHSRLGQFSAALEDADEALRLRPDWAKAHGRRGAALHGLGDLSRSEEAYQCGVRLEPTNSTLLKELQIVQNTK